MDIQKDFADLCSLLNANHVEYLIVGGYAVAFHGAPRFTGDLDIWARPVAANLCRMLETVREFGFPIEGIAEDYLQQQRKILQLGRVPVQVHIMSSVSGLDWETAWASKVAGAYGQVPVHFIGREALLANKRASGRMKDLADVEALERPRERS
jgi:hypothetical protein